MKKLRSAVIGVGYLGRFHAQKYKALEAELPVSLVGVCDRNPEQAAKVGQELGVPSFSDPRDLLNQVDLVSIATVTSNHFEVAREFLRAGVHCNVEKPMTVTVAESEELVQMAEQRDLQLCVGHSERFNPAYQMAREIVKNPVAIELLRHAPYKERGADVSVIHDLMVHDLDLLCALVPHELQLREARGGNLISPTLDWAEAGFTFGGNRTARISVSRVAPQMTRSLRVTGVHESVLADLQTGEVQIARFASRSDFKTETVSAGKGDNLLAETRAFIQAVRGFPNDAVNGRAGLKAMQWIHQLTDRIGDLG